VDLVLHVLRLILLAWAGGMFEPPPAGPCVHATVAAGIECGTLHVFENRATRQGRRIPIAYAVATAIQATEAAPVFLFAGGPGQGSTALINMANGWAAPLRETRDLVFIDQRGTGRSNPLSCSTTRLEFPEHAFGHVFDPEDVRACRATLEPRADLTLYTTAHAIEDIDDVRARLGYDRILLWGGSYGTRMAQAYARRYPARVIAMVLDGVAPFDVQMPSMYARGAQVALERVFEACRADANCAESYPSLAQDFAAILRRIREHPGPAKVRTRTGQVVDVTMSAGDFGYAVRGILYDPHVTARLPEMIHRAAVSGDLSEFAQRYWARAVSLERSLAHGLHLSVLCPEDIALLPEAEIDPRSRETFLGSYVLDEYRQACRIWPAIPSDPDSARPLDTSVPTLLLSGHFDPVTPPEFAQRVARSLPLSAHVVDAAGGHGVTGRCALAAVLHVLTTGTIDNLPVVCRPGL
jgi:pimeloyl-ACP methyl ester carboxylesterase